jgi:hypothetical protein
MTSSAAMEIARSRDSEAIVLLVVLTQLAWTLRP